MPLSIYQILLKTESVDGKFQTSIHQKGGVGGNVCVSVCGSVYVSQHHHE